jgi:hypothetical protein
VHSLIYHERIKLLAATLSKLGIGAVIVGLIAQLMTHGTTRGFGMACLLTGVALVGTAWMVAGRIL